MEPAGYMNLEGNDTTRIVEFSNNVGYKLQDDTCNAYNRSSSVFTKQLSRLADNDIFFCSIVTYHVESSLAHYWCVQLL